jgi:hypothetical protein
MHRLLFSFAVCCAVCCVPFVVALNFFYSGGSLIERRNVSGEAMKATATPFADVGHSLIGWWAGMGFSRAHKERAMTWKQFLGVMMCSQFCASVQTTLPFCSL